MLVYACVDCWTELSGVSEGSVFVSANYEGKMWECYEPDKSA